MIKHRLQHIIKFYFTKAQLVRKPGQFQMKILQQEDFHIDQKPRTQKKDLNKIIEQMYYFDEAEAQVGNTIKEENTFQESQILVNTLNYEKKKKNYSDSNGKLYEDDIRINKTCSELLEYYKNNESTIAQDQPYVKILSQISYCLNYESSIRTYFEEKRISNQTKLRQLNKNVSISQPIFLTRRQLWNHEEFQKIMIQIGNLENLDMKIECRKLIHSIFMKSSFFIDQKLFEQCMLHFNQQKLRQNKQNLQNLQIISFILTSIKLQIYSKAERIQLEKMISINSSNNVLEDQLIQIILKIYDRIDYSSLDNDQIYYLATYKLKVFQFKKVKPGSFSIQKYVIQSHRITYQQCAKIFIHVMYQNLRFLHYHEIRNKAILLNLFLEYSEDKYRGFDYDLFKPQDIQLLSQILIKFQDFLLQVPNNKISHYDIQFDFGLGFVELYDKILLQLGDLKLELVTAQNLIQIAKNNYISQNKIELLTTRLIRDRIQINPIDVYYMTSLGAVSSAMYEYTLFIFKQHQFKLNKQPISGLLEGNQDPSMESSNIYGIKICLEIEQSICAIWSLLCQNINLDKDQILDYEIINEVILKLNQSIQQIISPIFQESQLRLKREIVLLANQVNAYIQYLGRNQFPSLISINLIYESKIVKIQNQIYPKPMRIEHTIFLEEKKGFAKKYMRFIQKDHENQGIYFDWQIKSQDGKFTTYIILHEPNEYNTNITVNQQNPIITENHSIKFLRKVLEGQTYIEVGYQDLFESTQDDGLLLFERILKDKIPLLILSKEELLTIDKNTMTLNNLKKQIGDRRKIPFKIIQTPVIQEDQEISQKDEYILSDQESE